MNMISNTTENMQNETLIRANEGIQPEHYSEHELRRLREFINVVKNDKSRSELVCWGNYSDYCKGY